VWTTAQAALLLVMQLHRRLSFGNYDGRCSV